MHTQPLDSSFIVLVSEIGHGELVSSGLGGVEEVHLGEFKAIEADPP